MSLLFRSGFEQQHLYYILTNVSYLKKQKTKNKPKGRIFTGIIIQLKVGFPVQMEINYTVSLLVSSIS